MILILECSEGVTVYRWNVHWDKHVCFVYGDFSEIAF